MSGPFPHRSWRWWALRAALWLRPEGGTSHQRHGRVIAIGGQPRKRRILAGDVIH